MAAWGMKGHEGQERGGYPTELAGASWRRKAQPLGSFPVTLSIIPLLLPLSTCQLSLSLYGTLEGQGGQAQLVIVTILLMIISLPWNLEPGALAPWLPALDLT